jgi:hypothetical protein
MLINKKHVKTFTLDYCKANRPKFTRVSNEFYNHLDFVLREKIRAYVHTLPSVGVTIK